MGEQQWNLAIEGTYDDDETVLEIDIVGRGNYNTLMAIADAIRELGFRGTEKMVVVEVMDG